MTQSVTRALRLRVAAAALLLAAAGCAGNESARDYGAPQVVSGGTPSAGEGPRTGPSGESRAESPEDAAAAARSGRCEGLCSPAEFDSWTRRTDGPCVFTPEEVNDAFRFAGLDAVEAEETTGLNSLFCVYTAATNADPDYPASVIVALYPYIDEMPPPGTNGRTDGFSYPGRDRAQGFEGVCASQRVKGPAECVPGPLGDVVLPDDAVAHVLRTDGAMHVSFETTDRYGDELLAALEGLARSAAGL